MQEIEQIAYVARRLGVQRVRITGGEPLVPPGRAQRAGQSRVKVHLVDAAGVKDDEVVDFARFATNTGRVVRFIEYLPLDAQSAWERHQVMAGAEIVLERVGDRTHDRRADRCRLVDGAGEVGIIASVTDAFCGPCTRLRLAAHGAIRNCLFGADKWSARYLSRRGGTDDDLDRLLRAAVWAKLPGPGINGPSCVQLARPTSGIGG